MISLLLSLCAASASEAPPSLRTGAGTPWTEERGELSAGVFAPIRFGVGDGWELETTGLLGSLLSPRIAVKHTWINGEHLALGWTAGVTVPTLALRLLRGTAFPSETQIGLAAIAGAGLIVGWRNDHLSTSLGFQARVGLTAGAFTLESPDLPWFDPMLAPLTEGGVGALRLVLEWQSGGPADRLALTSDSRVQIGGHGPDLNTRLFALLRLSRHLALGGGAAGSYETYAFGSAWQVMPLLDLQGRW